MNDYARVRPPGGAGYRVLLMQVGGGSLGFKGSDSRAYKKISTNRQMLTMMLTEKTKA